MVVGGESALITNGTTASRGCGGYGLLGVACPSTTFCEGVGGGLWIFGTSYQGRPCSYYGYLGGLCTVRPVGVPEGGLNGIACPGVTTCVGVGYPDLVLPIINGTPGSAMTSAASVLRGIACPDITACEAVGENTIQPILKGVPAFPFVIPQTISLLGVACPSATSCVAVGTNSLGM